MKKKVLCKDQRNDLVSKLTNLFKGVEAEEIDDAVEEAKRKVSIEISEERKRELGELFDSQVEILKSRGCPKAILESFQDKRDEVLNKAAEMEIPEGNIPFIPVIPRSYMTIYGLMPMVRNDEKVGYTYLDPNELSDVVETPDKPYFMFNVEDGRDMLGKSPEKAEKLIKKKERSCLTDNEGIALCIQSDVLLSHNVDCTGSRYEQGDGVPIVYLDGGKPRLSSLDLDSSHGSWGSASCEERS